MRALLLVALLSLLAGCAGAQVRWHTPRDPGPLESDAAVALHYAEHAPEWTSALGPAAGPASDVPVDAMRVAELEVVDSPLTSWSSIRSGVEDSARELGANTIVVNGMQDPTTSRRYLFFTLLLRE